MKKTLSIRQKTNYFEHISSIDGIKSIPLNFLNVYDLTRLSMGSKTMKENAEAVPGYVETKNFMKQIEQFRLSKPEFHNQLIQVFNNDPSLTELYL